MDQAEDPFLSRITNCSLPQKINLYNIYIGYNKWITHDANHCYSTPLPIPSSPPRNTIYIINTSSAVVVESQISTSSKVGSGKSSSSMYRASTVLKIWPNNFIMHSINVARNIIQFYRILEGITIRFGVPDFNSSSSKVRLAITDAI